MDKEEDSKLDIPVTIHNIILKMVYEAYMNGIEYHKSNGDSVTEEELYKQDLEFQNLYNDMVCKYSM